MKGGIRFTEWGDSREIIDCQHGKIPYRMWCEYEVERILATGVKARMLIRQVAGKKTEVCVSVNGRTRKGVIVPMVIEGKKKCDT